MNATMSLFDLRGRTALVTGASRGLGRAMARGLAHAGARVVLADVRDTSEVERELREAGGEVLGVRADVSRPEDVDRMVETADEEGEGLDVLVNNAGIFRSAPAREMDRADWERVLEVNLSGSFHCARAAGRRMLERGGGSIINVASVAGLRAFRESAAYNASKGGLIMLTRTLAAEWAEGGVRVNALCPGVFATPMTEKLRADESFRSMIDRRVPLKRHGEPEELAGAAVYLASRAASYVTGAVLVVDGGWTAGL